MWDEDGPEKDPMWLSVYVIVVGTTYAASILLNFWLLVAGLFD